jgi:hypothetical protein
MIIILSGLICVVYYGLGPVPYRRGWLFLFLKEFAGFQERFGPGDFELWTSARVNENGEMEALFPPGRHRRAFWCRPSLLGFLIFDLRFWIGDGAEGEDGDLFAECGRRILLVFGLVYRAWVWL